MLSLRGLTQKQNAESVTWVLAEEPHRQLFSSDRFSMGCRKKPSLVQRLNIAPPPLKFLLVSVILAHPRERVLWEQGKESVCDPASLL
jgi:hypothetical protein